MAIAFRSHCDSAVGLAEEPATILWIGWKYKGWVALGLFAGIVGGIAAGMLLPRTYQSTAQIAVIKKRPDTVSGVDTRHFTAEDYLAPPQDLLKSSAIIDRAIRSKGIAELPSFAQSEADLTEQIRAGLTVTPSKGPPGQNVVFKLAYRAADTEDCRLVLTSILDSFQDFIDKKHQTISVDSIELILREKQTLQKSLEEKEVAYTKFRERAPLLGTGKDGFELRQERLNTIQAKRSGLLLQRIELEGQLAALDAAKKEGRGQEALLAMLQDFARRGDSQDGGRQVSLQEQLLPLLQEERRLRQVYGAKHPDLLAVQGRIEATRHLLVLPASLWNSETGDGASTIKSNADAVSLQMQLLRQKLKHLQISEECLAKVFQTEQDEARRLAAFEIQNDSFRTSIHLNQQMYEALVKRLNEASLIKNVGGYQVEWIEPPSQGKRVAPSMAITLLVGSFLGLTAGFMMAYLASRRLAPCEGNTQLAASAT